MLMVLFGGGATAILNVVLVALLILQSAGALTFDYTAVYPNTPDILYEGAAYASGQGVIELTKNDAEGDVGNSWGRAIYSRPLVLWNNATGEVASFTTRFTFYVSTLKDKKPGDGFVFFLSPYGSNVLNTANAGVFTLFDYQPPHDLVQSFPTVAVEFDTYANSWDPKEVHVGIDVNSIVSVADATWKAFGEWSNDTVDAVITYKAGSTTLEASFTSRVDETFASLSYDIDLKKELPQWVQVGFAATTGVGLGEIHRVKSWSFESSTTLKHAPSSTSSSSSSY